MMTAIRMLQQQNEALMQRLGAMEKKQGEVLAAAQAVQVPLSEQDIDLRPFSARDIHNSAESSFWIRMKPYNKHLGHLRKGCPLNELADSGGRPRYLKGGTNMPGDICQWILVPKAAAFKMARYRQRDEDPSSPMLLDIVTARMKEVIEVRESAMRAGMLGLQAPGGQRGTAMGVLHGESQVLASVEGGVSATASADLGLDPMASGRMPSRVTDVASGDGAMRAPTSWEVQRGKTKAVMDKLHEGLGGDISMGSVSMGGRLPPG